MVDSVGTLFAEAESRGVTDLTRDLGRLADQADRAEKSIDNFNDQTVRSQRVQRNASSAGGAGGPGGGGGLYAAIAAQALLASKNTGDLATSTRDLTSNLTGNTGEINRLIRANTELSGQTRILNRRVDDGDISRTRANRLIAGHTRLAAENTETIKRLASTTNESTRSLTTSTRALGGFRLGALGAGAAVVALGVGLISVASNASQVTLNLGRAVAETSTLLEGTSQQIRELTQRSAELAATFGGSAASQALGFYAIYSAGAQNATEALDTLVAANRFAIGGVTDLASATQLLTGTLNAYSQFGYTATQVSDIFFEVIRNGITTAEQLAASFANVSSIAAGFGVNLQVTGSAVAALTATGTQTAMATTQIRAFITALQNLNDAQREAIRGLGVSSTAPADFAQVIRELELGLSSFGTATERSSALGEVFGSQIEALAAALSLTGGGFDTFERTLDATNNSLGATSRAFEQIAASDAQRLSTALGEVERANVSLGESVNRILIPIYERWGEFISNVATALNDINTIIAAGETPASASQQFVSGRFGTGSNVTSGETRTEQAARIRLANELAETNELIASTTDQINSSQMRLNETYAAGDENPLLVDNAQLIAGHGRILELLQRRLILEQDAATAQLNAGRISQQEFRSQIQFGTMRTALRITENEELRESLRLTDRLSRARNLTAFLNNQPGTVSAGATANVGIFNDARNETQTPEAALFAERRAFYEEEERQLELQLRTNNELIAGSTGEQLALYVSQGAQIRLQIRSNAASYEAEWDAYYGLQNERDKEASEQRLAVLQAEADAFVAGVVSAAERTFNANKRADERAARQAKRATDEALREAARRRRLLARLNPPSNPALSIEELLLSNSASNAFVNDGFDNRRGASDAINDFIDITGTAGTALENLATISDQSANSVASALGSLGSIVGAFNPVAGLFINTIGGIISALDAVVGTTNDTGFRANAGVGGVGNTQVDQRRTGLRRLFLGRNTSRDTTAAEQLELQRALRPNIEIAAMIGELFDVAFTNVSAYGETVRDTADSFLNLTAMQVGGIEALQMSGESLGQTLIRVAASADEANQSFIEAGFLAGINPSSVAGQLISQVGGLNVANTLNLRSDQEQQGLSLASFTRLLQSAVNNRGDRLFTDSQITAFSTDSSALLGAIETARRAFDSEAQGIQQILDLNRQGRGRAPTADEIASDRITVQSGLNEVRNLNALLRAAGFFDEINVDDPSDSRPEDRASDRRRADIRLADENFRTDAERRIAETTLENTIGFELDERRNILLEDAIAELRRINSAGNENTRQGRISDFANRVFTNTTISNANARS